MVIYQLMAKYLPSAVEYEVFLWNSNKNSLYIAWFKKLDKYKRSVRKRIA